jgi:hypothetical protein
VSEATILLLRRGLTLWGVPREQVRGLDASTGGVRVTLPTTSLLADEVIGLARDLEVRPVGALVRRYWHEHCRGLAVHGGLPLVVVDADHPPHALLE